MNWKDKDANRDRYQRRKAKHNKTSNKSNKPKKIRGDDYVDEDYNLYNKK